MATCVLFVCIFTIGGLFIGAWALVVFKAALTLLVVLPLLVSVFGWYAAHSRHTQ